jgi:hypothetical protein
MRAAGCFALACIVACGARTIPLVAGEAVVPTCSEAVSNGPDASGSACVAAAALVACVGEDGTNEVCISNDPSGCSNGTSGTCHDECSTSNEYAIACEGHAGVPPQPPTGCQNYEGAPTGTVYYCCPCSQ